jgi:hypothetical protein
MATGVTRLSDVIVPQIFTPYKQQLTEEKTAFIASGAMVRDAAIDALLAGGGLTFNVPSFKDLDNDTENTSSDDPAVFSAPKKIGTAIEIAVRLSRNNSWSSMDLNQALISADPMKAIADRVAFYWARRLQAATIASLKGVFADNDAAPAGSDTHIINDLKRDVSGGAFIAGVTNFTAEAVLDAAVTMGDSMGDLSLVCMHSIVYARAQKNNLIDFIPDSNGVVNIPTFLGRRVVVDDGMPAASNIYETWLFGSGALRLGAGAPKVPTETDRLPSAGNGGGQEVLYDRVEWAIHPAGHAYVGTAPNGGPDNTATANNLAAAASWSRRFPERKQIKIARLITREA